jgi:hypothetical protein
MRSLPEEPSTNGHVAIERPVDPPPPSEAVIIDSIKEVQLTSSQLLMLTELSSQAQSAAESAEAVLAVARQKQAALDQAVRMVLDVANVSDIGYHSLLDRQRSALRLVPSNQVPR